MSGGEQSEAVFVMPGTERLVGWVFCGAQRDGPPTGDLICPACEATSSPYPAFRSSVLDRFASVQQRLG